MTLIVLIKGKNSVDTYACKWISFEKDSVCATTSSDGLSVRIPFSDIEDLQIVS